MNIWTSVYFSLYLLIVSYENIYNIVALTKINLGTPGLSSGHPPHWFRFGVHCSHEGLYTVKRHEKYLERALWRAWPSLSSLRISQYFMIFEASLSYSQEHTIVDSSEPDESIKITVF
jgi:hypothetical protein